jgi:capsular polysaccharide biosynthesis protein
VIATLVALLGGLLVSTYALPQLYRATAVIMITGTEDPDTGQVSYLDVLANKQLVKTYCEIVPGPAVMEQVAREVDFKVSAEDLRRAVRVTQRGDTVLMEISVLFPNPRQAASIANTTAGVFIQKENTLLRMANARLVDPAVENKVPVGPNILLNTVAGALIGFILAVFGCLMVDCVRRSPGQGNMPGEDEV